MKRSRLIELVGAAAGASAVGFASVAASSDDRTLHLAAGPADFAALGLGQTIAMRRPARHV